MKKTDYASDKVKRVISQFNDREKYYREVSSKRYVSFCELDEAIYREEDTVEYALNISFDNFCKQQRIIALKKALFNLSDDERQIVKECFYFKGKKRPSYSELSKKYGISRQAYCKRLDKVLKKLKADIEEMVTEY